MLLKIVMRLDAWIGTENPDDREENDPDNGSDAIADDLENNDQWLEFGHDQKHADQANQKQHADERNAIRSVLA